MTRAHGTNAKFIHDECRCEPCRAAHLDYERGRRAALEPAYVSATAARAHCRELMAAGVGLKQIVKHANVSHGVLWRLLYGKNGRPSKRIRRATEQRILAVTPAHLAAGAKIDAAPTWLMIDAMVAAGVSKADIARGIGQVGPQLQLSRASVTARNARAIAELHAAWLAGRVTLGRRDCHGNYTPAQPPRAVEKRPAADISDLLLELADIVEERREQAHWRRQAACAGRGLYLWFPGKGDRLTADHGVKICSACFVRDECRAANIDQREGTYGALTAGARRALRRQDASTSLHPLVDAVMAAEAEGRFRQETTGRKAS